MGRTIRGIHELYAEDPEKADRQIFGRKSDPVSRRDFLTQSALAAMSALVGGQVVFAGEMPAGLIPATFASSSEPFQIQGKDQDLIVLNDRPLSVETPAHLLDDPVTPARRLFVRNNGIPPGSIDLSAWTLTIEGESISNPKTFSLGDLKRRFTTVTYQLTLECAGNGRSEFYPPALGNQWTVGAVGSPQWTGVRLKDVLAACGVKSDAVYIGYYGADRDLSGNPGTTPISRGVPIEKALQSESIIAWQMNGQDLPLIHGNPLRLVFGGWPGSTSGKWLNRIVVRNKVHDGPKMGGKSYRVPCSPVAPGEMVDDEEMCIIESMPVKSLVTHPKSGIKHPLSGRLEVRGHAWAGELDVSSVHISIDFGQTWVRASLSLPKNKFAWQHWRHQVRFPRKGYYEIWVRATDSEGKMQPMVVPCWNPRGYLNNACHRIAVRVV